MKKLYLLLKILRPPWVIHNEVMKITVKED